MSYPIVAHSYYIEVTSL